MNDVIEFLRARLDEDEQAARAAGWHRWVLVDDEISTVGNGRLVVRLERDYDGPHITRHDPARVLREVDAKRRIVELHGPLQLPATNYRPTMLQCEYCASLCHSRSGLGCDQPIDAPWPCDTVRLMALPYADHPDFDESWRP